MFNKFYKIFTIAQEQNPDFYDVFQYAIESVIYTDQPELQSLKQDKPTKKVYLPEFEPEPEPEANKGLSPHTPNMRMIEEGGGSKKKKKPQLKKKTEKKHKKKYNGGRTVRTKRTGQNHKRNEKTKKKNKRGVKRKFSKRRTYKRLRRRTS